MDAFPSSMAVDYNPLIAVWSTIMPTSEGNGVPKPADALPVQLSPKVYET
jgi:hypothetical protein